MPVVDLKLRLLDGQAEKNPIRKRHAAGYQALSPPSTRMF